MKQSIFLFLLNFLLISSLSAQEDSTFTLQECIDYALKNNYSVQNAQLDEKITQAQIRETRAAGYPTINGAASLVDNPALQRMFFSPANPFLGGGGGAFPGAEQSGDVIVAPNLFQLRSAGDANAQINQLLFDGSYVVGLQAASTYRELSEKQLKQAKVTTVENVTKTYYAVLIAEESVKMFDINLRTLDTSLNQLRIMYETGLVEDIDVKRLEVQYNNLMTDKQNTENLLALNKLRLKLSMGMPLEQPVSLADSINSLELNPAPIAVESFVAANRIEYSILQTQERLSLLDMKRYKFSRLPTLTAFAKGGFVRQDVKFLNLLQNEWFGYSMLGLSLNVPILDLRRHYQIHQAKYNSQKIKNSLQSMENGFKLESSSARLNFNNSLQAMQNQKRNMELAQEVLRVAKIKYQEGIGSNLEVVTAEADLQAAQINYYNALYNGMVARIDYLKSIGTLYNE